MDLMLNVPLHPFVCWLHPSLAEIRLCSAAIPSCAVGSSTCPSLEQDSPGHTRKVSRLVLLALSPASVSSPLYALVRSTGITLPASLEMWSGRELSLYHKPII